MLPAFTLGTATAALTALVGITFVLNGLRFAFIDEVAEGGMLLLLAWFITTLGPLL